jgi:hypothetical protein
VNPEYLTRADLFTAATLVAFENVAKDAPLALAISMALKTFPKKINFPYQPW